MKHASLFLIVCLFFSSSIHAQEPFFIGIHDTKAGFFACVISALNNIQWCIRNNKTPAVYWDSSFAFYDPQGYNEATDNCWEYYFEPVSSAQYNSTYPIHTSYYAPDGSYIFHWTNVNMINNRHWVKSTLIDQYIHIKPAILKKINAFYNTHMAGKKTIGIHLRGTDKHTEVTPVSVFTILAEADKYKDYQFYIATDEHKLLNTAKHILGDKVIHYDCFRSNDNTPIHHTKNTTYSKAQLGEDVLIEAVLLSRCDKLIHTNSNVSTAALYFNPNLENTLLENKGNHENI